MKIFWLLLFIGLIATGCSSTQGTRFELVERYQLNDVTQASYADYQRDVKARLKQNWRALLDSDVDLPGSSIVPGVDDFAIDKLVELHAPTDSGQETLCRFEDGRPRGMLLLHGLYDSPYTMRDLEAYFRSRCFFTRSILLPGHGTRPGSLLEIKYEDWIETVNFAIAELGRKVDSNVYMAGFSTGGALALNSAFENQMVKGVFLFAPALKVDAAAAYKAKKLGLEWVPFHRLADRDAIKYESITLDSAIAVDGLAKMVEAKLKFDGSKLTIPVLVVVAENDYTVKAKTAIEYFGEGRFGTNAEMIIYSPAKESEGEPAKNIPTYVKSRFVHQQDGKQFIIADYSHMALTLRSDDAHYGLQGAYQYCLQYVFQPEKKKLCEDASLDFSEVCFGERRVTGSETYAQCSNPDRIVRRLTSNPQFDGMTRLMDRFINRYID